MTFSVSELERARRVIKECCTEFGLEERDVFSKRRRQKLVECRQEIYLRIREVLGFSYPEIGRLLDKDHSTVFHGVRMAKKRREVRGEQEVHDPSSVCDFKD